MSRITPSDCRLIGLCLDTAASTVYFPDWEFSTLFGLERKEVRDVARRWPVKDPTPKDRRAVSQSIGQLLGYPHGGEGQLVNELGLKTLEELADLLQRWRNSVQILESQLWGLPETPSQGRQAPSPPGRPPAPQPRFPRVG